MIFGMNQTIENSSLFLDLTENDMIFQPFQPFQPKWQPCKRAKIVYSLKLLLLQFLAKFKQKKYKNMAKKGVF